MPLTIIRGSSSLILAGKTHNVGEEIRATYRYTGPSTACLAGALPKGTWGTGDLQRYQVENSVVTHRGDEEDAELVINWAWAPNSGIPPQGASLPATLDSCRKETIDFSIDRLANWLPLRNLKGTDPLTGEEHEILPMIDIAVQNPRRDGPFFWSVVAGLTTEQKSLVGKLYDLKVLGTTHKRIWMPVYVVRSFHWVLPVLDEGGWCTAQPIGPNAWALPGNTDWLRTMDEFQWTGAHHEVVREWIGLSNSSQDGSVGGWSSELYPHP